MERVTQNGLFLRALRLVEAVLGLWPDGPPVLFSALAAKRKWVESWTEMGGYDIELEVWVNDYYQEIRALYKLKDEVPYWEWEIVDLVFSIMEADVEPGILEDLVLETYVALKHWTLFRTHCGGCSEGTGSA